MKKLFSLILGLCLLSLSFNALAEDSINWREWSPQIFKEAQKQHKLVMVFGKAEWCPWCQRMKSNTYADPEVIALMNKSFIPVHVDVDQDSALAEELHIDNLPTILFMNANQKVLKETKGYTTAGTMIRYMKEALSENH